MSEKGERKKGTTTFCFTAREIEIIELQDEIFGFVDYNTREVLLRVTDHILRIEKENANLRERVASIEAKLAEKEGEL